MKLIQLSPELYVNPDNINYIEEIMKDKEHSLDYKIFFNNSAEPKEIYNDEFKMLKAYLISKDNFFELEKVEQMEFK